MPSPFDPEGWRPDPDGTITNVALDNPSGQSFVGLAEQAGAAEFTLTSNFDNKQSFTSGESVFTSVIYKVIGSWGGQIQIAMTSDSGLESFALYSIETNTIISGSPDAYLITDIGNGFYLLQQSENIAANKTGFFSAISIKSGGAPAPIGAQLYVQAAFFGKADDFPANVMPTL